MVKLYATMNYKYFQLNRNSLRAKMMRIIKITLLLSVITIPIVTYIVKTNQTEEIVLFEVEDMNLSRPIYKNGVFDNPWSSWSKPDFAKFLKFLLIDKNEANIPSQKELDTILPVHEISDSEINEFCKSDPNGRIKSIWIGHATSLVNIENKIILMDPIFSQRASPVQFMGPKRFRDVPIKIDRIPRVDTILLSHNHYDHLDENSVDELNKKFGQNLTWLIPVGTAAWFKSVGVKNNLHEFSWWQTKTIDNLEFVFTPAQHWSTRGLLDRNKSLWGGWIVLGPKKRFYFAGDTGYCPVFTEIGRKYGPFDLSFIPIGAYKPRWMMQRQHVDPEEAVKIHLDVKSNKTIPIHWGTFSMAHEFYLAPKEDLEIAMNKSSLSLDEFKTHQHGRTYFF